MGPSAERLRVLSLTPGRMRFHLPGWTADDAEGVEARLGRVSGVEGVQANPRTGNVLVRFDPRSTGGDGLLAGLQGAWHQLLAEQRRVPAPGSRPTPGDAPRQAPECRRTATSPWARVAVRGLLGHAVVDSAWFAAGFLGQSLGLPLAGLGPLHVLMDLVVWGAALGSANGHSRSPAIGAVCPASAESGRG